MKITETIMIYSVDQVAQERGYPVPSVSTGAQIT